MSPYRKQEESPGIKLGQCSVRVAKKNVELLTSPSKLFRYERTEKGLNEKATSVTKECKSGNVPFASECRYLSEDIKSLNHLLFVVFFRQCKI